MRAQINKSLGMQHKYRHMQGDLCEVKTVTYLYLLLHPLRKIKLIAIHQSLRSRVCIGWFPNQKP
jgi:hypothetical protein